MEGAPCASTRAENLAAGVCARVRSGMRVAMGWVRLAVLGFWPHEVCPEARQVGLVQTSPRARQNSACLRLPPKRAGLCPTHSPPHCVLRAIILFSGHFLPAKPLCPCCSPPRPAVLFTLHFLFSKQGEHWAWSQKTCDQDQFPCPVTSGKSLNSLSHRLLLCKRGVVTPTVLSHGFDGRIRRLINKCRRAFKL